MVAVFILGVGISVSVACIGELIHAEAIVRGREKMHRLALDMYEELRATGDFSQAPSDGDFQDRGEPDYTWKADLQPTGVENLNEFSVTVSKTGNDKLDTTISGLIYKTPAQGTGTGG